MNSIAEHYTYRVRWSPEDSLYVGTVADLQADGDLASVAAR